VSREVWRRHENPLNSREKLRAEPWLSPLTA